jgi:hypothetical protein
VALNPDALDDRSWPQNAAMRWMHSLVTSGALSLQLLIQNKLRLRQRFALLTLDFATSQAVEPVFASAYNTLVECTWEGVTCNVWNQATSIVWAEQGLGGTIPQDIGLMTTLTHLDLGENSLGGSLPESLYELVNLQYLYLHSNRLTGSISEDVSKLSQLINLYLGDNALIGRFPLGLGSSELGPFNVRPLRTYTLRVVSCVVCLFPISCECVFVCHSGYLNLYNNQLTGSIPSDLNLRNLFYFDVGYNNMEGVSYICESQQTID